MELAKWAMHAYEVAKQAGEAVMAIYQQAEPVTAEYKEDNTPLTIADKTSHRIIQQGLTDFAIKGQPAPVLSEEGRQIAFIERQSWQCYWCVDPLDGTKDFLARNDEFTINISLVANHRPIIGIIYVPAQKCGYLAWHGGGAYCYDEKGNSQLLNTSRPSQQPLRVVVSRYQNIEKVQPWLTSLGATSLTQVGSALKFCVLAKGEADLFLRLTPSYEWDNAAGQCLVEEAGGAVYTWDMASLPYNQCGNLEQKRFIAVGDTLFNWQKYLAR